MIFRPEKIRMFECSFFEFFKTLTNRISVDSYRILPITTGIKVDEFYLGLDKVSLDK